MRGAFRQDRASWGLPVFDEAWKGYVVLCDVCKSSGKHDKL